uniref:hypothetical protein n=1 Tax=Cupriavidus gilardii TaxID=82541 RepID=UPI00247AAC2E|nr:hypothetical protein [Cupriavidus gilardii]
MVMAYYPALRSGKVRALRITCAAAVGAATFLNLAWCLWALGAPIDIGAVRRGQLHGQYWVGPFAMAYAVFCWARFRKAAAEGKDG